MQPPQVSVLARLALTEYREAMPSIITLDDTNEAWISAMQRG